MKLKLETKGFVKDIEIDRANKEKTDFTRTDSLFTMLGTCIGIRIDYY